MFDLSLLVSVMTPLQHSGGLCPCITVLVVGRSRTYYDGHKLNKTGDSAPRIKLCRPCDRYGAIHNENC